MKIHEHICSRCSITIEYTNYSSWHSAKTRNGVCKSCRTAIANQSPKRNTKKENNSQWKGYKEIPYHWFSRYFERKRSKNRKVKQGDITIEQVYDVWINQNKKCALSGLDIGFYDDGSTHTCSIDRIDSLGHYTIDNIQLVHKDINLMKNRFNQDYFIKMCQLITENHNCELV